MAKKKPTDPKTANTAPAEENHDWVDEVVAPLAALVRVNETIKALRISRRTLYRLIEAGRIRTVRPTEAGTSPHLIARSEIARYLHSLEVSA